MRTRNEELENEVEVLKQEVRQLEEDRADVVAHLELVLRQKVEEANELSERLAALEELRKEEQTAFKKREAALELEYRNMENTLSAEVKLAGNYWIVRIKIIYTQSKLTKKRNCLKIHKKPSVDDFQLGS